MPRRKAAAENWLAGGWRKPLTCGYIPGSITNRRRSPQCLGIAGFCAEHFGVTFGATKSPVAGSVSSCAIIAYYLDGNYRSAAAFAGAEEAEARGQGQPGTAETVGEDAPRTILTRRVGRRPGVGVGQRRA